MIHSSKFLLMLGAMMFVPAVAAQSLPPPPPECTAIAVQGTLTSFRTGPKGEVNGFFLDTSPGSAEVHFPPHEAARLQAVVGRGAPVRVSGCLSTTREGNTHVRAEVITNLSTGQLVAIAAPSAPPPPSACTPSTFQGGVASYRYGPKGEVDGLILDTGSGLLEVRFPPHEGARVQAAVPVGSEAIVTGCTNTGPSGDTHVGSQSITNEQTGQTVTIGAPAPTPPKPRR